MNASLRALFSMIVVFAMCVPIAPAYAQDDSAGAQTDAAGADPKPPAPEPEPLPPGSSENFMIAAANPWAAKAGLKVLKDGGSAVDAAIATQMVLTLVEPQSSGIGGGAFMLHYNAAEKSLVAYDGRETAPAGVRANLFYKPGGELMSFYEAVVGGRAVGVPGVLRMLEMAHQKHGNLRWSELFDPAIKLAEKGFPVSERLHELLLRDQELRNQSDAQAFFYPKDGAPRQVDENLQNFELAETFRAIASDGADAFYRGDIAAAIVSLVQGHENTGFLSMKDMALYKAKVREPVCRAYRSYRLCGMPPPTSGGLTTLQIMALLEQFEMSEVEPGSAEAVHLISEASRLAYADRALYMADPDFIKVPGKKLLETSYIFERGDLISETRSMGKAKAGVVPEEETRYSPDLSPELPSTTHFTIVDGEGNVVTMTSSIENTFGSRLMVKGFFLNNQLTDFSFTPRRDGKLIANRIQPGKRPRSSMSPMIAFDGRYWGGPFLFALGSPGGSRIINYVTKTMVAMLDWGLPPADAVALPHHSNRNGVTELEAETAAADLLVELEELGHRVKVRDLNSGLHVIKKVKGGYMGGADPRREGVVLGELD